MRRHWLLAGSIIGAIAEAALAQPLPAHHAAPVAQSARLSQSLTEGWRFRQADAQGAQAPDFDDGDWEQVAVPHSWNRVGYYDPGAGTGSQTRDSVNKAQGIGWYRLGFAAPAMAKGQRLWLQFDAASRVADVWLNGKLLGRHEGGFSRFRFDATEALRADGRNILAVRVDNSHPAPGTATANTFPLTGDFFVYGGLYRPVSLIVTDAVHFDMLDFGGPGVYARTDAITAEGAKVGVRAKLRNDGGRDFAGRLVARLVDADGAVAAENISDVRIAKGQGGESALDLVVPRPRLWQGVDDPYLYQLVVELRGPKGEVLDSLAQDFGIRQIRLDPDKGMILNGKAVRLKGVGLHQDREGKGWVLGEEDIADTFATIRDMGANSIRLTHYQHGEPIHRLADRHGFILWDEIALVTAWTLTPDQQESPAGLIANARQQLQEMIRQNYNHASVALWGIANEVDFGPNRPDFLGNAPDIVPDPAPLLRELNALSKAEDPSRPTTMATCCEDHGMQGIPVVADLADTSGVNRYYGWYYGKPAELGAHLDHLHAKRPMQPLAVAEYGAGGAFSIHSDDPLGGPIDMAGRRQPEEYQSWVHEQSWPVIAARPYLFASWLWNSFDFSSTARREGDSQDINTKGLVSYDGKTRKDAFYYYRANWSAEPTVHITGRRYADRAYGATDIRVYSNASATELRLNGRSLGVRRDCVNRICIWPQVRLDPGANRLTATGQFAGTAVEDGIEWKLDPARRNLFRIDSGAVVAAEVREGRFGSDAFFSGGTAGTMDRFARGKPPQLAAIAGNPDRDLLTTYREGDFGYSVPLDNGRYMLSLTFVEPSAKPGERQFTVLADGQALLRDFDIAATAGAPLHAITRSFPVMVRNGRLDLRFVPVRGKAIVSAVEITPRR